MVTLAFLSLLAWVYLSAVHWGFWRADQRLPQAVPELEAWPSVVAVVPARNEAPSIAACVGALMAQDYPGDFRVIVVDDHSEDGTGDLARGAGNVSRLTVMTAPELQAGWTGKLSALNAGVGASGESDFVWFTDADIVHAPATLRRLVGFAETRERDLVSLMVRLNCVGFWEMLVIPAFVFFFQMLYPFRAVNDDRSKVAAAAGGCVLLRRGALDRAGGIAAIKGELIDDCSLAKAVKTSGGRLWLGLADDSRSLRAASGLDSLWHMVRRTAFTQLHYSYVLLAGTTLGLLLVFVVPAVIPLTLPWHGLVLAGVLAALAWAIMALCYTPTLKDYGLPAWQGVFLPLTASLYCAMTIDSALAHQRGRGGAWKGRHYDSSATPSEVTKSPLQTKP